MDRFAEREEGFERAFAHQEELRFKARARRDRRLAAWVGETLGFSGSALAAYADGLVARGLQGLDDEALVAELTETLAPRGVSEHRVRRRLAALQAQSMDEIQAGR